MPNNEEKPAEAKKSTSTLANEIQSTVDKETAQGFRGTEVDSTPNENYTVAGVTKGLPTPETDAGAAKASREDTGLGLTALEWQEGENKKRGKK